MTDKTRESLSALMDGEASEIEIHRLLREIEQDPALRKHWIAYQQIRSAIRQEPYMASGTHLALAARVRASIDAEETYNESPVVTLGSRRNAYLRPVAGLAVAASLVAAIFLTLDVSRVGEEQNLADGTATAPASGLTAEPASAPAVPAPRRLVDGATLVSTVPVTTPQTGMGEDPGAFIGDDQSDQPELRELDEERMRQVRAYLLRHDRVARMNPYARVVTNPQGPGK